jgi:hypothetical protein
MINRDGPACVRASKESTMIRMGVKAVAGTGVAAAFALTAAMSVAAAQNVSPQVAVPDRGNGGIQGCYRIQGQIYGPYRVTFCLGSGQDRSYRVRGGGLDCRGGLRWSRLGNGRIQIDLQRSSCGNDTAWSADTLICRPVGSGGSGASAQVAVPDDGGADSLRCRYIPAARGYKETTVIANRQD